MPSTTHRQGRRRRGAMLAALVLALMLTGCVGALAPMKFLLALALVALLGLSCSASDVRPWTIRCEEERVDDCDDEECDGHWQAAGCNEGAVVYACCPDGMACNYGWGITICDDGTCVDLDEEPEGCAETCDGYWEAADCDDGEIVYACCPDGMACNYGWNIAYCDDGTCVDPADYPEACEDEEEEEEETCDGYWEEYCNDGAISLACCPEGMACNYGMSMVSCGDGTCVEHPETCPE